MTSVVSQWEKAKLPLLPQPHPLTKYCTRDYVHHICPQATFGQDRPRGYFSPYSQAYHSFFFNFFLCMQKAFYQPRAQAVEPNLTRNTPTDAYSLRGSAFWGLEDNIFTSPPSKPPKTSFLGTYNGNPIVRICPWS